MKHPLFYAKVLLFGEYGVMENAKALTIPFNFYKGALKLCAKKTPLIEESQIHLRDFCNYLDQIQKEPHFEAKFKIDLLRQDLHLGLHFDSNIPQGYGVGSSGALVAAIYDRYAIDKIDADRSISKKSILQLKTVFGSMESFFHGSSSGIDPLICYLNFPLLVKNKKDISTIGLSKEDEGKGAIFLLNSGYPRKTEPMIQLFFEKLKQEGFRKTLKSEFVKYNDACIDAFLKGETKSLFKNLKKLSSWALVHLNPMIPPSQLKIWKKGIKTNAYYLKLCGSGGGGYILGFTEDYETALKHLKGNIVEVIHRF